MDTEQTGPVTPIGLYLVIRDEAMGIGRCIESCKELVNPIMCLVDDRTTDASTAIVEKLGGTATPFKWAGDFSKARNAVLELLNNSKPPPQWALCLDGHEYLAGDVTALQRAVNESPLGGFELKVIMEDNSHHWGVRLHRVQCRWTRARHNLLTVKGKTKRLTDCWIVHDRVGGQAQASRDRRNKDRDRELKKGLFKDIRKNPRDTRSMFYLAQQFRDAGEQTGAFYWYTRYLRTRNGNQWPEERFLAMVAAGTAAFRLLDVDMALWYGGLARDLCPKRAEGWALLGDVEYNREGYLTAVEHYETASKCKMPKDHRLWVDATIYRNGWLILDKLAMCSWNLGLYKRGAEYCRKILGLVGLPKQERKRIEGNLRFHIERAKFMAG